MPFTPLSNDSGVPPPDAIAARICMLALGQQLYHVLLTIRKSTLVVNSEAEAALPSESWARRDVSRVDDGWEHQGPRPSHEELLSHDQRTRKASS
jgi:hypothetical protein